MAAAPSAAGHDSGAVLAVMELRAELAAVKKKLDAKEQELKASKQQLDDNKDVHGIPLSAESKADLRASIEDLRKDKAALNAQLTVLQEKENILLRQQLQSATGGDSKGAGGVEVAYFAAVKQNLAAALARAQQQLDDDMYAKMTMEAAAKLSILPRTHPDPNDAVTKQVMTLYMAMVRQPKPTTLARWALEYKLVVDGIAPYGDGKFNFAFLELPVDGAAAATGRTRSVPLLVKQLSADEATRIVQFASLVDAANPKGIAIGVEGLPVLHPRLVPMALLPHEVVKAPPFGSPPLPAVKAKMEAAAAAAAAAGAGGGGSGVSTMRQVMVPLPVAASKYERQQLSPAQLHTFYEDVSDALQYLHALNCTHSDIKPQNVGVCADGHFGVFDLGSVSPFGASLVGLSTMQFLPADYHARPVSTPLIDWLMLAMTMCALMPVPQPPVYGFDAIGTSVDVKETTLMQCLDKAAANSKWWPHLRHRIERAKAVVAEDIKAGAATSLRIKTASPLSTKALNLRALRR